jgi:hypothetical protein
MRLLVLVLWACSGQSPDVVVPPDGTAPTTTSTTGAPGDILGSCDKIGEQSVCTDYSEAAYSLGADFVKNACVATNGTYSEAPCGSDARIGDCALSGGQVRHYYGRGTASFDATTGQTDCTTLYEGTWSAP